MRLRLVHSKPHEVTDASLGDFQDEMNGLLRKLDRRSEFRVVDQSVQVCTVYDAEREVAMTSFTGIIWYEKVRKEGDA